MLLQLSSSLQSSAYTLDAKGAYPRQAAVLMAFTREPDPQVLLTRRSAELKRHSGEVAFPGGWLDQEDTSLLTTALRETQEELGVDPASVEVLGPWRSRFARGGIRVQPIVGLIDPDLKLTPNPDEIDEVFKVPVSYLLKDDRFRTDVFQEAGVERWIPAYQYQGFEIWGFTAGVLVDLLNKALGGGIVRDHPSAPVRHFIRN